ncbi:Probable serine/threonine-protein kinase zyg-1 (Zygote defective protein 1) [Durusdinium trenchii]|uniref:Probable serine/threonine-protein kinase zyg-1 (Zygote defective protein 1) n=1 Tax=Durusdinium trenchii TaxID=1381693 RepID=A0ABP0HFV8_9DINO
MLDRKNKTAWATYKREVELSQATTGKNIASVLEEFVDAERCYVIMEKFEGHLRKALKWVAKETGDETAGLDALSLGNVMKQVLSAILHLHTCGVVHRDVKAHNLLIDRCDLRDPRCRVVLSDFGLARRLEPGRFLCAQVGTRKYWAPELYEKKYWHVVDVFAIGVLMFLAASNSYPFQDEDQTKNRDVFEQDLAGLLPPLNDRQLNPPRKQRPLKPVLRSTKAFGGSRLSPDLRDFFAMACRRYNPHETSFHMEARIGFRRPKSFVRLRPLAPGTSSCGDLAAPNMEAAPWGALKRLKGSSVVQSQPILSTPQSRQSRQTQDDEVHELLVDLEEHERVAADAIGKVFRDAFAKDGGWHRAE